MSPRYDGAGKNRSAMVHASRSHECSICGKTVFGNGGQVSHGRGHVKRGEAVELFKECGWYNGRPMTSRLFLMPDDERIAKFEAEHFTRVIPPGSGERMGS